MPKTNSRSDRAYLVRCWQTKSIDDERPTWCFSVEEILPQQHKRGFSGLEAFLAFWRAELSASQNESSDGASTATQRTGP